MYVCCPLVTIYRCFLSKACWPSPMCSMNAFAWSSTIFLFILFAERCPLYYLISALCWTGRIWSSSLKRLVRLSLIFAFASCVLRCFGVGNILPTLKIWNIFVTLTERFGRDFLAHLAITLVSGIASWFSKSWYCWREIRRGLWGTSERMKRVSRPRQCLGAMKSTQN